MVLDMPANALSWSAMNTKILTSMIVFTSLERRAMDRFGLSQEAVNVRKSVLI
jgi:hypothetical protein